MHVKIIMHRKVTPESQQKLMPFLIQLRGLAEKQAGYVKGETLINKDDPSKTMVISTWENIESWEAWLNSHERQTVQQEVENILEEPTYYQVYYAQ
ncbi:MAG: antibiotic biosynthesis monooxygenase [Bacteriovoracaceae bacterium]|nr:antibiotic biosynthesis monooxygenase [Bacteriovoracaceae bacterium]